MAKARYNSVQEYVDAVLEGTMTNRSLSQLKQYYKNKGNTQRVAMIDDAFFELKKIREGTKEVLELIDEQQDGDDYIGFRD